MDSITTKKGASSNKYEIKINTWIDQLLSLQPTSILPQQQQQQQNTLLKSRWFRVILVIYISFSLLFTSLHFTSWLFTSNNTNTILNDGWKFERTYDADESYSLISTMSEGLKMSKLFSKGHYDSLKHIQPYWKTASNKFDKDDVTIITTTTPSTWKELIELAKNWQGPISTTLHVSSKEKEYIKLNIEKEINSNLNLFKNIDIHLVETKDGIEEKASILIPLNVERNVARIYSRTNFVSDIPLNSFVSQDLNQHVKQYKDLLTSGDVFIIPTFKYNGHDNQALVPQTKKELVGLTDDNVFGLYDASFHLNDGPTDYNKWKQSNSIYPVKDYTMDYEPVTIQSKTIQPWCSERFVNKKSACLLSSYLAGNNFYVLPNDYVIQKPTSNEIKVSDLDRVIEKRLYAKFYWEQCVYHGRQLDALGSWTTTQSEHIRQQCSRVIQNWGRGLIGKPE